MFEHHVHHHHGGPGCRERGGRHSEQDAARPFDRQFDPRRAFGRAFARFGGGGHHGHFEKFFAAGGMGGRERFFEGGDLQLVILALLAEKPSYGYELIKAIEDRMGGGYAPSPGVVYPTLTLLEERGFAQVEPSEGNRKTYRITEAGQAELQKQAGRLADLMDRFQDGRERFGQGRSPKIRRGFMELRQAIMRSGLRAREAGSGLSEEQIDKISEAIQQAIRSIDAL